jgi:hypothetical protein
LPLDPLQFLLVLFLHDPEWVHEFFDDLQRFLDGVVALLVAGQLRPLYFSFLSLTIQVLLELDDLVGQLLDLLLVDVGEVIDVGIVKLLNRFRKFGIDVDEFLEGSLERDVLLVQLPVLLPQVLDIRREVGLFLPEERRRHRHGYYKNDGFEKVVQLTRSKNKEGDNIKPEPKWI